VIEMDWQDEFYTEEYDSNREVIMEVEPYCICCDKKAWEVHHISRSLPKDVLNNLYNLIGVCCKCHDKITILEHRGIKGWAAIEEVNPKKYHDQPELRLPD